MKEQHKTEKTRGQTLPYDYLSQSYDVSCIWHIFGCFRIIVAVMTS